MSVLIKGMEMPQSCAGCPLSEEEFVQCKITRKRFLKAVDAVSRRHPYCPLVEIPPHGRLIDADALAKKMRGVVFRGEEKDVLYHNVQAFLEAPTVIEAERVVAKMRTTDDANTSNALNALDCVEERKKGEAEVVWI